ncbi:MAG: rRNA pseudouridine synthase [Clostridiales bacterium]|nr:rRNA pseudouridine synthase [Clostridiales bacterium]
MARGARMRRVRLDKLMSDDGYTRSEARAMIAHGRVTVDGAPATSPGAIVDADACRVEADGRPIRQSRHLHLMLNKPAGVLTATSDGRDPTVVDLLPDRLRRVGLGPVGRLDKDATGLILLTTDGQLAHRLISPRWEKVKVYWAGVASPPGPAAFEAFARGVELSDFTARPAELRLLADDPPRVEVRVTEGKYHQVKRMLAAVGCPVTALHRVEVAGIRLPGDLPPGGHRELTAGEIAHLYAETDMEG